MPISLSTHFVYTPDPNCPYVAPVKWYLDSNSDVQFVLDVGPTCSRVYKNTNGTPDFGGSLAANKQYRDLTIRWYTSLVNASKAMCAAWNDAVAADPTAKPYRQVTEALAASGLPLAVLEVFTASIEYVEGDEAEGIPDEWLGVKFVVGLGKAATYSDYLQAIYSYWHTLPFAELPACPKIFTNDPSEKAFALVDLNPYMVQCPRPLAPAWKEWFSKFTPDEQMVILAWTWALLCGKNKGRQSIWIIDLNGYSGKSVYVDVITEILGSTLVSIIGKDSLKNQFGYAKVYQSRLVAYPDCKNRLFPKSEAAHVIPGGDHVDVEMKGKASFSAKMNAKMLVCSNEEPSINPYARHERSRWIVVRVNVTKEILDKTAVKNPDGSYKRDAGGEIIQIGDATFRDRLLEGKESLFENAYHAYKTLCPTDADIILPDSVSETLYNLDDTESTSVDSIVEKYFKVGSDVEDDYLSSSNLHETYMTITTKVAAYREHANDRAYHNFVGHLAKMYKINKARVPASYDPARPRMFKGIAVRWSAVDALTDLTKTFGPPAITNGDKTTQGNKGLGSHGAPKGLAIDITKFSDEPVPVPPVR